MVFAQQERLDSFFIHFLKFNFKQFHRRVCEQERLQAVEAANALRGEVRIRAEFWLS